MCIAVDCQRVKEINNKMDQMKKQTGANTQMLS